MHQKRNLKGFKYCKGVILITKQTFNRTVGILLVTQLILQFTECNIQVYQSNFSTIGFLVTLVHRCRAAAKDAS